MNENKRKTTVQSPVYCSTLRHLLALLSLCFLTTSSAWGDFQTGKDAYVREDYATALKEFRSLAEQGNAKAQHYLGVIYTKGRGVRKNDEEAVRWYRKAAEQGHVASQSNLGVMYEKGRGVGKDYITAYMWYILAAAEGTENEIIRENFKSLTKEMTRAQIAEVRRRADEWKRRKEQPLPQTRIKTDTYVTDPSLREDDQNFVAAATRLDAFDQTVVQIKALEGELEQKRRLIEQKIDEEQKTNPLNAPKDQFESDADYAARKSQLASLLLQHRSQLQKRYLQDIQNRVADLYQKTFQTSDITVTLGAFDANSQRFPITFEAKLNGSVQSFERYLWVNKNEARSLYSNWNQVTKTSYISIDPGYRRGLVRVKLEYPPIWRQGVTFRFDELFNISDSNNDENRVVFSPDGKYFAAIGVAGRGYLNKYAFAGIWETKNRNKIWLTNALSYYPFTAVVFSPDGKYFITTRYSDGTSFPVSRKWEMKSGKEIWKKYYWGIAFSPDWKYLVTARQDNINQYGQYLGTPKNQKVSNKMTIWSRSNGKILREIDNISSVFAFSPDWKYLAMVEGQSIVFWQIGSNITTKTELKKEKTIRTSSTVRHLAWSPNGLLISDGKKIYRTLLPPETQEIGKPAPSYPPALAATVHFSEASGNNFLDANEKGTITVTAKNSGKGYAAGVQVAITPPRIDGLSYANATIGDIPPGESRSVEIPIEASIRT